MARRRVDGDRTGRAPAERAGEPGEARTGKQQRQVRVCSQRCGLDEALLQLYGAIDDSAEHAVDERGAPAFGCRGPYRPRGSRRNTSTPASGEEW